MLEITSPEPALWRMQALEDFDGNGWDFDRERVELPEPAAGPGHHQGPHRRADATG